VETVKAKIKLIIITVVGLLVYSQSSCQNISFPDSLFKLRLIENGIDTNSDGEISFVEASSVTTLDLSFGWDFYPIQSLVGIEFFTNLEFLDCSDNNLNSLNLEGNAQLATLLANTNSLDTLIFGFNSNLEWINLNDNTTSSIFDFSGLPNLRVLRFKYATDLDMTSNPNLEELDCSFSYGAIDVSNNPNLEILKCRDQSVLDLSSCTNLQYLRCVSYTISLDSIDLSENQQLLHLDLWHNNLSSIDLSQNIFLEYVQLGYNYIPSIDFTANPNITYLTCGGDSLRSIDITGLINLETLATGSHLDPNSSNLDSLDLSTNVSLKYLSCSSGNLTELDISQNLLLEEIYCGNNELDTLILCSNPNLEYLHCANMPQLTHIFVFDSSQPILVFSNDSPNWQYDDCNLLSSRTQEFSRSPLEVYPNPTSDFFQFSNVPLSAKTLSYEIRDLSGKLIVREKLMGKFVDSKSLNAGIYMLILFESNEIIFAGKLIKKNGS
jgi:hypothetical protein